MVHNLTDNMVSRRDALRISAATAAALLVGRPAAQAAVPPQRNGKSHMKLSLAAYSFNRTLPKSWTPDQLPDE